MSYSNAIFCSKCFDHFRCKKTLETHEHNCGKQLHTKVFPNGKKPIHYNKHECNFKRIFFGYADIESVLEDNNTQRKCSKCCSIEDDVSPDYECFHSYTIPVNPIYPELFLHASDLRGGEANKLIEFS